ncbi:MAG: sulfatase [Verrucomicrobiales bacterium]|nr:sulfatase [Verrucomicrobiales bacterium]
MSRREWLQRSFLGLGSVAAADLLSSNASAFAAMKQHHRPLAKRIIYVFLEGGLSQLDSYDYKPALAQYAGKPLPDSINRPEFTFAKQGTVIPSPFEWKHWGESGTYASDLFPEVNSRFIDDLCFIHSLNHKSNDHITAKRVLHTGVPIEVRPTLGSWLVYGLGSMNDNLPAYLDITPTDPNRPTGFLPSKYGGTTIDEIDRNKRKLEWENLEQAFPGQEEHIDFIKAIDAAHAPDPELDEMELAFRMQTEAPDLLDIENESEATKKLYGIGEDHTDEFGRALLLARRFSEAGVRYITVNHATPRYGNLWDQHSELEKGHRGNAHAVDRPIAGLLHDLKVRGMLDDTLVICGSEFGRTPTFEFFDGITGKHQNGRDHNPHGFTTWFAGGGVKRGYHHGATDDFGYYAVRDKVDIHDFHATLLHIMGIDHEALTYFHGGRDFRLTDVYGNVVEDILS